MAKPAIFEGLNDIDEATARRHFEVLSVAAGTIVIHEGDVGRGLACLIEGELEIRSGDAVVGRVAPGAILGEVGLFEDNARTATVNAPAGAVLWLLSREAYEELRDTVHPICANIERTTLDAQVDRLGRVGSEVARLGLGIPTGVQPSTGFFAAVRRLLGSGGVSPTKGNALAALLESPLFVDAPEPALEPIAASFEALDCAAGAFLCTEGEIGDSMYMLESGSVDVVVNSDGQPHQVSTLGPGAAFGMVSLARSGVRMASCVVSGPSRVHRMDHEAWHGLVSHPYMVGSTFRRAVIRAFSEQLRYSNNQLAAWERTHNTRHGQEVLSQARQGLSAHGGYLVP